MVCKNCNATLDANAKFCPECGAKVEKKLFCSNCGVELKSGSKFCPECGAKVGGAPSGETKSEAAVSAPAESAAPKAEAAPAKPAEKSEEELREEFFELRKKKAANIELSDEEWDILTEIYGTDVSLTDEQESEVLKIKIQHENWDRLEDEWQAFDENSSLSELEDGAENGNAAAKYFLALMYRKKYIELGKQQEALLVKALVPVVGKKAKEEADELGRRCEEYRDKEFKLSMESAGGFYPPALCWCFGFLTGKHPNEAFNYAKWAAEYGSVIGLVILGDCYYNGTGVDKDLNMAELCSKLASSSGIIDELDVESFYNPNPSKVLSGDDREHKFVKLGYWKEKGYLLEYLN